MLAVDAIDDAVCRADDVALILVGAEGQQCVEDGSFGDVGHGHELAVCHDACGVGIGVARVDNPVVVVDVHPGQAELALLRALDDEGARIVLLGVEGDLL